MAGLGWACPPARIQPRAKHSMLISEVLPSLVTGRARGSSPFANRGSLFRKGGAVGYLIAAGLPLTWSPLLGCKRVFPGAPPPEAPCCQQCPVRDPHSSEMQSTQQVCVWRWPQRRFLKAVNSTAGSSGTGGAVAGNQHHPSWLRGASMWYFCSDSDTLSVLWDEHFAQSAKELWGQSHPASVGQSEQKISPLMLQISRKTAGTEVQLCQLPLPSH